MATTPSVSTGSTLEGTLSKWTNVMKGWQYRFFVLDENAGLLSYYTSKEKMMKGVRRGCVRLKDAVIGIDDQEDNTFTITVDHKTFHFQAQHSEEREKWVRRLEDTIRRHANRSRLWDSQSSFYIGGYGGGKDISGKRTNHLEVLGRRVSEADAYLQLMIEQINKIENRVNAMPDPDERAKCKALQENASAMLDHIKHSIVSIQIAKNMAHPINGIYNGPTNANNTKSITTTPIAAGIQGSLNSAICDSGDVDGDDTAASTKGDDEDDCMTPENGTVVYTTKSACHHRISPLVNIDNNNQTANTITSDINNLQLTPPLSADIVADAMDGIAFGTACLITIHPSATSRTLADKQLPYDELASVSLSASSSKSSSYCCLGAVTPAQLAMVVPETSYSSSEDDEDFYDANDDPYASLGSSPISCATRGFTVEASPLYEHPIDGRAVGGCIGPSVSGQSMAASGAVPHSTTKRVTLPESDEYEAATTSSMSPRLSRGAGIVGVTLQQYEAGNIDYDALYEEEEDTNISMEAHGSMISHLLSQVKIGMDLTKVVLPTFILERRSLLEMYADYFAHPDLFLKIADLDTPRERIVQVCRWYLSAYHAGRKSAVAKKPYNPILGEVFQCHWDISDETPDEQTVDDGPIPWCRRDQLTFLAEQVSHHPPISAFYAEHYNKNITFSAHVWTKSKFLGLSIGVHNIGEGIVTLVDRSEEYIVTFPNGYGRSILTVPWIELGGSVEIRCPQTGHYANVEFLTKPFYGGKRNKVTAEIYAPNEKKPFVSIAGEWSGLMEAKWHATNDSTQFEKTEVFVDVNRIPIFKKQVRPIVEQEACESRRVWKEVTAGLKFNDIEKATNAKCTVEQLQREQAKQRKEVEKQWEQKYFKPVGDNWIYTQPLSQRVYMQEKQDKR